jgi:selenocysteine lyase/cysteine desulfurase
MKIDRSDGNPERVPGPSRDGLRSASRASSTRRDFLSGAVGAAGAALAGSVQVQAATAPSATDLSTWAAVRDQFLLTRDNINLALMLLTSHPRPVREALDRHRRALDEDPVSYLHANIEGKEREAREAAASYLGAKPDEIALTGNTTTGLALLYGGLPLRPGQEIVTTTHDHYVTHEALRLRAVHTGATFRKVPLYAVPEAASEDEIISNMRKAIGPRTRALAVTWVHSSTGVKLPIRHMADALADINRKRDEADRVLLCVDGVHAFGVEQESVTELGCDFLVAGCHKWLFGPRGTGLVWGRSAAWKGNAGIIPTFDWAAFEAWMRGQPPDALPPGPRVTPGGFQAFEHRWALGEAFRFHQQIGKARVTARIHELGRRCKEGLAALPKVHLRTPKSEALSAGLVCFEVDGSTPKEVVDRLLARKIIASTTPYATSYARFSPGLLNTPEEIDRAVAAVAATARPA